MANSSPSILPPFALSVNPCDVFPLSRAARARERERVKRREAVGYAICEACGDIAGIALSRDEEVLLSLLQTSVVKCFFYGKSVFILPSQHQQYIFDHRSVLLYVSKVDNRMPYIGGLCASSPAVTSQPEPFFLLQGWLYLFYLGTTDLITTPLLSPMMVLLHLLFCVSCSRMAECSIAVDGGSTTPSPAVNLDRNILPFTSIDLFIPASKHRAYTFATYIHSFDTTLSLSHALHSGEAGYAVCNGVVLFSRL